MKDLLRRELWRLLLCLCLLTSAAAFLWARMTEETLPLWIVAALLVWCLLLGLSRRAGAWGPAALCLLALLLSVLPVLRTLRGVMSDLAALAERPGILPALLALCSALLWYAPDRFAFRAGAALVWLGLWLTAALLGWKLPRLTVTALLPLPLLAICEAVFRLLRRNDAARFRALRGGLCLVLVCASALTLFAPTPAEPYGYPIIRAVIRKVDEFWREMEGGFLRRREGDRQFTIGFDGIPEEPETGNAGGEGGQSLLYVQPFNATTGPLYLSGNTWDRFDGRRWTQAVPEEDESALLWNADTLEHLYALWRWQQAHGGAGDERFFRLNHIFFYYGNMDTRTMFGAMNALHFYYDAQRYPSTAGANGILFDYLQNSGTVYRMYWLEPNARTLKQLVAYSEGYVYDPAERRDWSFLKDFFEPRFFLDFPAEDTALEALFSRRQALIRARDLDAEGVSPRAAALAAEITAACRTDYEKLLAIAAYLQDNYRYTTAPTPVPEGENFLDWLLFETGEGYCTWYATAAALLARSVGIPTRYVQGYLAGALPARRYTALDPEAAHAWCEGYVAGYGWVTVEATPGFASVGTGWAPAGRAALQETVSDAPQGAGQTGALSGLPLTVPEGTGAEVELRLWYLALLPPCLALLLAARWLLRRRKLRRRYLAMSPQEQVRQDLEQLLRHLRRRGYPRAPEASLSAYFASLPWLLLPAERGEAMAMAEFYESVLFGGRVPSAEETAAQRSFVEALRTKRRFFR